MRLATSIHQCSAPHSLPACPLARTQFNEFDAYLKGEGVDGGFTDAATVLKAYVDAQETAGYAWPLNARLRWNARPASCKRSYVKTQYGRK